MPKKIKISEAEVAKLASYGCTATNIADWFGVSVQTITRRFAKVLAMQRARFVVGIRQAQLRIALQGDAGMLKFLGERECGQVFVREAAQEQSQSKLVVVLERNVGGNAEKKVVASSSGPVKRIAADCVAGGGVEVLPEQRATDIVRGASADGENDRGHNQDSAPLRDLSGQPASLGS